MYLFSNILEMLFESDLKYRASKSGMPLRKSGEGFWKMSVLFLLLQSSFVRKGAHKTALLPIHIRE